MKTTDKTAQHVIDTYSILEEQNIPSLKYEVDTLLLVINLFKKGSLSERFLMEKYKHIISMIAHHQDCPDWVRVMTL